jgi:pimeloyl-ACP methyl ester carboxylesterase
MLLSVKSTCAIWSGVVKPADDFSLSLLVFDALALLDLIGADRAHIVGNSAGGYVSQQLAITIQRGSSYSSSRSSCQLRSRGVMMQTLAAFPAGAVVLQCDGYSGRIADVAADATAFPRRKGRQFCIQYYSSCTRAADTPAHVANVAKAAM